MKRSNIHGRRLAFGLTLGVIAIGVAFGSSASARALITGADVKNGSLSGADIKSKSIALSDLTLHARASLRGQQGATGPVGPVGAKGATGSPGPVAGGIKGDKGDKGDAAPVLSSGNWGVINRNTMGSPSAFLRSGPGSAPPFGKGSLNLLVGGAGEKVAYGNELDFSGTSVSSLTAVGFYVYTTGEDIKAGNGTPNMPGIAFEIDPNVPLQSHYSSLVFMPNNTAANTWSYIDATKADSGLWGGTGSAFAGSKCDINGTRCTWDELQAYLTANNDGTPAHITYSAGVTKGRDFSWQGAIDGLRINDKVFDFEETGVVVRPAA